MELKEDIELGKFWELYQARQTSEGLRASVSDFMLWLGEEYPEMFVEADNWAGDEFNGHA